MAVPCQSNAQDNENTKSSSARTDRPVVGEFNQNANDKENTPEQETEPSSPGNDRDKLVSSILNADNRLSIRPSRVRRLSHSFDDITVLPNIPEE